MSYLNPNGKVKHWESLASCGAKALWSCSQSLENMVAMRKAGIIPFLVDLIKLKNRDILVPVAGILEECAIEVFLLLIFLSLQIVCNFIDRFCFQRKIIKLPSRPKE